jgi:hypothetical protein
MSTLEIMYREADALFAQSKYPDAYEKYDAVFTELFSGLQDSRAKRRWAKGIGLAAAFVTGGFGLEDLLIVPAVNSFMLNKLGFNLNETLARVQRVVKRKVECACLDAKLAVSMDKERTLGEFLLLYKLDAAEGDTNMLFIAFEVCNPLMDDSRVKTVVSQLSGIALHNALLENVWRSTPSVLELNRLLLRYLKNVGLTASSLYTAIAGEVREKSKHEDIGAMGNRYLDLLKLSRPFSRDELKRAYHRELARYHPDKVQHLGEEFRRLAELKTKEINLAYEHLQPESTTMADTVAWGLYSFTVYPASTTWNDIGGVYIFAGLNANNRWVALYIGETSSLKDHLTNHECWAEAARLGATHIHAIVVAQEASRVQIKSNLIKKFQPRLNTQQK